MEQKTLTSYILEQVHTGASKSAISEQLLAVGWSEDEIDAAYAEALITEGIPVPNEGSRGAYAKKSSAVEVVINLFSFILLGIVVIALGTLYFNVINFFFPDVLAQANMYYYSQGAMADAIHYAMAALLIGFPLYVYSVRLWFTKFREDEGKVESKLTKWITYIVLLVAAVTIVGDLIAIVNTFLQGEISIRFFLKGLTVLLIASAVFSFYFLERKKVQYRREIARSTFLLYGWILSALIVLGLVLGFVAVGSPNTERMRTFDERRASDLEQMAQCVHSYVDKFEQLPETLDAIEKASVLYGCTVRSDPETQEPYMYSVIMPLAKQKDSGLYVGTFELCATFALQTSNTETQALELYQSKWYTHEAGMSCFTEDVSIRPVLQVSAQPTQL
jgi:Domain of unknown function (DUF5671)